MLLKVKKKTALKKQERNFKITGPKCSIPKLNGSLQAIQNNMKKTCILIVGPTAVGKTALAIRLARYFNTRIISCDSRQCYEELNIGVAKPSAEDLALVPHHFINSHSIHDLVTAAAFEKYALEMVAEIFAKHDVAVMVGGTGLYAKAFCDGIDEIPEIDESIRHNINQSYHQNGLTWVQEEVKKNDPEYFTNGEIKNPRRLLRVLEVKLSTGQSIRHFQIQQKKLRDFTIIKIGLEIPRTDLIERINQRVNSMMKEGLPSEVKSLLPYKKLNALQTVGYKELFSHFSGGLSLTQATEAIKINTRQYAKRQMTWFKKDTGIRWCKVDFDEVLKTINAAINSLA